MSEETKETLEQELEILEEEQDTDIVIDKNEKKNLKKVKRQRRKRAWFIFWNLLSILYYGVTSFLSIKNGFKNDVFTYIILAGVIVYTIAFIVIIIKTSTNTKIAKTNMATFKTQLKIVKILLSVFNIILTVNILVNLALNITFDFKAIFTIIVLVAGSIYVFFKIIFTLLNLLIQIFKQARINKKRRKLKEKYLEENKK